LSDPWAGGSYSYAHIASHAGDRAVYAAPLGKRVFFAGEATADIDYGTVHAALLSGDITAHAIHAHFCCRRASSHFLPYAAWQAIHPRPA
jgi:hypothetical protein